MRYHFIRDLEVDDLDGLDHADLATALLRAVDLACLPYRVALFGPWGSGKTNVLRKVESLIDARNLRPKQPYVETLWFNPWEQEARGLLQGLIATVFNLVPDGVRYSKKGARVLARTTEALAAVGERTGSNPPKEPNGSNIEGVPRLDDLRESLRRMVELALNVEKPRQARMLVFIDDLDKCPPESVIAFLEACKIFFSRARVVFLFALDLEVLANAVDQKYGQGFASARYFDKIFEFAFTVHPLEWRQLGSVVRDLYLRSGLGQRHQIDATRTYEIEAITRVLATPGIVAHPREIKRIFNRFIWFLADHEPGSSEDLDLWLVWILVSVNWPEFRSLASRYGAEVIGELFNRVTGNLLFPHGNDLVRQELDKVGGYHALLDYFRRIFSDTEDLSPTESRERLAHRLEVLLLSDRTLRASGL